MYIDFCHKALVQENALKIKESHHGHGEDQKNTDLQPIANLPTKKLTKGDREKYGHKKNISFGKVKVGYEKRLMNVCNYIDLAHYNLFIRILPILNRTS